jgi:hypothetical protein
MLDEPTTETLLPLLLGIDINLEVLDAKRNKDGNG